MPSQSIASRRHRSAPPALNIPSFQPTQPVVIEKPWTPPRVLSRKRPTIKDLKRIPAIISKPTAKADARVPRVARQPMPESLTRLKPESLEWLDRLDMDQDRQSLADGILSFFRHEEMCCGTEAG